MKTSEQKKSPTNSRREKKRGVLGRKIGAYSVVEGAATRCSIGGFIPRVDGCLGRAQVKKLEARRDDLRKWRQKAFCASGRRNEGGEGL